MGTRQRVTWPRCSLLIGQDLVFLLQKIGENYDCLSACEDIDMRDIVATLLETVPHNPATGLGEILIFSCKYFQ